MCNDLRDYMTYARDPEFVDVLALNKEVDDVAIQRFACMLNDRARARE